MPANGSWIHRAAAALSNAWASASGLRGSAHTTPSASSSETR